LIRIPENKQQPMIAPKRVFVLLFNARTDNEGIYTKRIGDRDMVLMFESEDDATRYSLMLEAQDFPEATVEAIGVDEIEAFCHQNDYDWELIEAGKLEIPPEENAEQTTWQPDDDKPEEPEPEDLDRIRRQLEGLL
jgi:hypothetical protein